MHQAHVTTGLSIDDITARLNAGATVNSDGTLTTTAPVSGETGNLMLWIGIGAGALILIVLIVLLFRSRRRSLLSYDGTRFWR